MSRLVVAGAELYYEVDGPDDAPTIVFSNSLGADLGMWEPQVEHFAVDHRVVRYDQRGHGRSSSPPPPYTLAQLGGDVLALMDALDLQRADVVGLSMGGQTSLWLTANHPDRFRRAVHASTAATIGTRELWDERVRAVREGGMRAIRDTVVQRFFTPAFFGREPELAERSRAVLGATDPEGYAACCLALRDADLRELVPDVGVPSLVVAATGDVATTVDDAAWLHAHLPDSALVVVEDAAHLSNLEQPDAFNAAVRRFLDGADGG